jgi:hypothetical protein
VDSFVGAEWVCIQKGAIESGGVDYPYGNDKSDSQPGVLSRRGEY